MNASTRITVYGCESEEASLFREISPCFGVSPILTGEPVSPANAILALGQRCVSVNHKTRVAKPALFALKEVGIKYISTRSIGANHIDVDTAAKIGISVGNVHYSPDSVADYTLMLMLMAIRNAKSTLRRGKLCDFRLEPMRGRELRDLTVGVVGLGRIGSAVTERLRGFGCDVLAYDLKPQAGDNSVSLDTLLAKSDIVSLHLPLTAETHHLFDGPRLARLKEGAYLINTGRGALVDSAALLAALDTGRLGGAALDVVEGEEGVFYLDRSLKPLDDTVLRRLLALPNVVITPHTAHYTGHALRDIVENTVANCLAFERSGENG